jgi:hypothetical protein
VTAPPTFKNMRKLIIGASILLIFISIYRLRETVFAVPEVKSRPASVMAATPTPSPDLLLVSATPAPVPSPLAIPTPTPTLTLAPLKVRVVKHQPDQFRKGAIGKEEIAAIDQAIKTIPWSRNPNPQAAADEDYAAIVKECEQSQVHDLLTDLITEAVANDYQPDNEAANVAYAGRLNSDFEAGDQNASSNQKSAGEKTAEDGTSVDRGSTASLGQPAGPANTASLSEGQPPTVLRSKSGHGRHRCSVRHKVVDVKAQLIALWHQSLTQTEKSPKSNLLLNSHGEPIVHRGPAPGSTADGSE